MLYMTDAQLGSKHCIYINMKHFHKLFGPFSSHFSFVSPPLLLQNNTAKPWTISEPDIPDYLNKHIIHIKRHNHCLSMAFLSIKQ